MNNTLNTLVAFVRGLIDARRGDETGAAAAEYGLLLALIAVVIIAGVQLLGTNLLAVFNNIAGQI